MTGWRPSARMAGNHLLDIAFVRNLKLVVALLLAGMAADAGGHARRNFGRRDINDAVAEALPARAWRWSCPQTA